MISHCFKSLSSFFFVFSTPQVAGQASSTTLHIKTEELSRQYNEQLSAMRAEKDKEIERLRVRTNRFLNQIVYPLYLNK